MILNRALALRSSLLLTFTLLLTFLISICSAQEPQPGGTLTVGIRNVDYDTLDPHVSQFNQSAYVFRNIFDKLVYLNPDTSEFTPGLATSWEPLEGGQVWTLTLRDDVTFHDGTPFNAEAVKFNFDRMTDPETLSKQAGPLMGPYESTEIVDEYNVRVHFTEPYAFFLSALADQFVVMVSPEAVQTHGEDFSQHLVGTGPFKFVSEVRGNEVVLEKNPDYNWGPDFFHSGSAYLDRIIFRFILEDETRLGALMTGELGLVDEIPPSRFEMLGEDPNYEVYAPIKPGYARHIWINTAHPPTDDVNVRKAINYAIDREAVSRGVLGSVYPPAFGILTPPTQFYNETFDSMYPYDPQKAIELLEGAGWTEINSEGYRVKDGEVLSVYHATFPGYVAEAPAEVVQAQLKEVGIRFDINVMTGTAMMEGLAAADSSFNTALIAWYTVDPAIILARVFHSEAMGILNWPHFSTPELDTLLDAGLASTDQDERRDTYERVQEIVMEEATVAPLYADVTVFAGQAAVKGFRFDRAAYPEFFDIYIEE